MAGSKAPRQRLSIISALIDSPTAARATRSGGGSRSAAVGSASGVAAERAMADCALIGKLEAESGVERPSLCRDAGVAPAGVAHAGPLGVSRCRLGAGDGPERGSRLELEPGRFMQLTHLHTSEHRMPAWKHSQYFFRHPDFLQLQPRLCVPPLASGPLDAAIFGRNACGFRSSVVWMASLRFLSFSGLLWQFRQLQPKQYCPLAKHSQ